jgi:Phosphoenolpyruvate carboxylase
MLRSSSAIARKVTRGVSSGVRRVGKPSVAVHHLSVAEKLASPQGLRFLSSYSSFREPGSLFQVTPLGETTDYIPKSPAVQDRDAPLRADVRTMGSLLGQIIRDHHGDATFEKIEEFRGLAKKWREAGAGRDASKAAEASKTFDELAKLCSSLTDDELLIISRAFTHFLAIANSAEAHHRIRMLNKTVSALGLPDKPDSCGGVLRSLLEQGKTPEQIFECLSTQQTELVLTAHPTEVNRRVILEKQQRVQEVRAENLKMGPQS